MAFNRDGTALAAGTIADANSDHGEIVLWDVTDTDRPQRRAVLATPTGVTSLAFSPRTATLAASGKTNGAGNTWVALWDTGTPVPTRSYLHESLNQLLHDTEDPKPLAVPFIVAATPTAFSPDGRLLALSGSLWDVSDPSAPVRVRHANLPADDRRWPRPSLSGMDRAAFSPDGHRLAEAGRGSDEEVSLWPADQAVGAHPLGSVPARNSVQVGYHPGGHLLVTAEKHGAVRLWDVTDPALPVLAVTLEQTAQDVRFSPDGRTLMLLPEEGGAVQLWDLGDLPTTVTNTTGLDCRLVGTGLAEQVWTKTYASGLPYEQTCPR
ncbi:WD40 repeat domain-containing protein [Kitasatospora gansuensis]